MTDDTRETDPAEAELVAYLDGELGPAAAAKVEARLAADPAYRSRAAALRRSFALLDVLPRPEVTPTFAARTLANLPAAPSAGSAVLPAPLPKSRPAWPWAAGVAAAAAVAFVAAYLVTAAVLPVPTAAEPTAETLSVADLRIVENLPLYAVADDLPFVERLADPDLFGDESAPAGPAAEPEKPSGKALDNLIRTFRELPPDDRERVRKFDRQLAEQPPARKGQLVRTLEAYAAWLDRLPPADRAAVLAAPSADARLDAVRAARRSRWVAGLPP
ncbi:MAG: hypothetical protein K2X82_11745, partial [Gemmataceae bacterium]|nr:hypothetical protein [Gemmataceae bacterium]